MTADFPRPHADILAELLFHHLFIRPGVWNGMETTEFWKPVVGYESFYECSDNGRVRNVLRGGRLLSGTVTKAGHRQVRLTGSNRRSKTVLVHALVAAAFIGPQPEGFVIAHVSGEKIDCSARNLEYVTPKVIAQRTAKLGLPIRCGFKPGSKNYRAKLDEGRVVELRALRRQGLSYPALARRFSVSVSTAYRVVSGRWWRHVETLPCSSPVAFVR